MRTLPILGAATLASLIACSATNKTPREDEAIPSSGAAPAMAVADSSGPRPVNPDPAPAAATEGGPAVKIDLLDEAGRLHYRAEGGRSPFERVECAISWGAEGQGAKASAVIVARPGRFKDVKQSRDLEADQLRVQLHGFVDFDPMTLAEEQERVGATDLHTYTLTIELGERRRTVSGYGLQDGSDFARLIQGMDEVCDTDGALSSARFAG